MQRGIKKYRQKLYQQVIWVILIMLLVVGCGGTAPTPTAEPTPEPIVEVGEVTFDGTDCTYSGLTEMPPGKYSIVLNNLSDDDVILFVERFIGGKTYQELLELQGEPGAYLPYDTYDEWFNAAVEPGSAWLKPDGGEVHTYIFIEEGQYTVAIWIYATETTPIRVWFCEPIWVKEVPSG